MTKRKENLIQKATELGKTAFAPAVEFTNLTIRVADRSARQQFQNMNDYAKFSFQQVKALPKVRSFNDAKSFVEETKSGATTYAIQSFQVVKEAANDYQGWLKDSVATVKKAVKPAAKKTTRKSTAKPKAKSTTSKAA